MKILEVVDKLEKSAEFLIYKGTNPTGFLMTIFCIFETEHADDWTVSYYNPSTKKSTSFHVSQTTVLLMEVHDSENVKELNLRKPNIELEEALSLARENFEKKSPDRIMKTIAIMQNLDDGQVWNISFLTSSFNVYNCKIHTESKEKLEESLGKMFRTG